MRSSDTCFSQSQVNSISQLPTMYHNVPAQTSQINFCQQQQQQQQQPQQHQSTNQQPMQCQPYYCYPTNQQGGTLGQNQYVQPYQQDPYGISQQQQPIQRTGLANVGQALAQASYTVPSIMQSQGVGYGSLPFATLDQIRSYIGTPGPIFILPSNCPNPGSQPAQAVPAASPAVTQGCPGIGINCPSSPLHGCPGGGCYPFPIPMPMNSMLNPYYQPVGNSSKESTNCGCCPRRSIGQEPQHTSRSLPPYQWGGNQVEEHRCSGTTDDTICSRKNCPSAINLQALASQLLAIPGVISCAATRMVLRKVPGSNITTSTDESIERAKRTLVTLTKDQLLAESRGAQQVNALINLHMTANPPINVIPILTTLQLKVNLLKSQVDASLNRRLSENQGLEFTEGAGNLDSVMLATKSDQELRDLLGTLRKKECDERVNLNFAPYKSQRTIAESRLTNVQNKIAQIEEEMDRRRASILPRSAMGHQVSQQLSDPGCAAWYGYTGDINNTNWTTSTNSQSYESPDPFRGVQVRNPKRLNLKPHVGSPETTYENVTKTSNVRSPRSSKDSDEEDCEDHDKRTKRSTSPENRCCNCDKSSDEESADEGKKKLGVKIHVPKKIVRNKVNENCDNNCAVSVVKLSPNVTIVIDNSANLSSKKSHRCKLPRQEKNEPDEGNEAQKENSFDTGQNGFVASTAEDEGKNVLLPSAPPMTPIEEPPQERKTFKGAMKKLKLRDPKVKQPTVSLAASNSRMQDKPNKSDYNIDSIESRVNKPEYDANKIAGTLDKVEDKKYNNPSTTNLPIVQKEPSNYEVACPEPVREETVRMMTKIQYGPTVFRAFNDTGKEKTIEERHKGRPCTEESSLKSMSTESSTGGSNFTNESFSLRVENYEETFIDADDQLESEKTLEPLEKTEAACTSDVETKEVAANIHKNRTISSKTKIDERNKSDEDQSEGERNDVLGAVQRSEGRNNDLISGALTTIGNHVASFGSIFGKIAIPKLHSREESSHEMLSDEKAKNSVTIEAPKENEVRAIGSRSEGTSILKNEDSNSKEIGRWKYIRFSEPEESTATSVEDLDPNRNKTTYTLPKLKHSVIENKKNGKKYMVVEKASKAKKKYELGEPYKTGRSLVIRSRLKGPQADEQSGPFTVIHGPKKRDKNCIALSFASMKSLGKNRLPNEIKTSDKFWLTPETRESRNKIANASKVTKCLMKNSEKDKCELLDLDFTSTSEHVVTVHDYSKISSDPQPQITPTSKSHKKEIVNK